MSMSERAAIGMADSARSWLQRIHALPLADRHVKIMNVCGGHERSISMAGLRKLLPDTVGDLAVVPGVHRLHGVLDPFP